MKGGLVVRGLDWKWRHLTGMLNSALDFLPLISPSAPCDMGLSKHPFCVTERANAVGSGASLRWKLGCIAGYLCWRVVVQ